MPVGALVVNIDTDAGSPGDDLFVTVQSAGDVNVASDLAGASSVVTLPHNGQISVGSLRPGVFALNVFQDENQFFTFLVILPTGPGQLSVTGEVFLMPRTDVQTFSNDVLTKFVDNLDAHRLEKAWQEAVLDDPAGAATAVGLVIAFGVASVVAGGALVGTALVGGAVAVAFTILGRINDKLIEDMKEDGSLSTGEADFLSLLWGVRSLTSGLGEFFDGESKIEKLKSALEAADAVKALVAPAGDIEMESSVKASGVQIPRGMVFVKINSLPQ
jgi:hypothetical protein